MMSKHDLCTYVVTVECWTLLVIQAKHMTSCYWGSCSWASDRHDPSLPYLEQYRIDPVQFAQLFSALAPWVCSSHTSTLSARLFRLLDQNQDGLVNFKEFVTGLSESRSQFVITCLSFSLPPLVHTQMHHGGSSVPSVLSQFSCSQTVLRAGGMYHGDMTEKLKLLYKLHLPQGKFTC